MLTSITSAMTASINPATSWPALSYTATLTETGSGKKYVYNISTLVRSDVQKDYWLAGASVTQVLCEVEW
jgi:hypothetical protein